MLEIRDQDGSAEPTIPEIRDQREDRGARARSVAKAQQVPLRRESDEGARRQDDQGVTATAGHRTSQLLGVGDGRSTLGLQVFGFRRLRQGVEAEPSLRLLGESAEPSHDPWIEVQASFAVPSPPDINDQLMA